MLSADYSNIKLLLTAKKPEVCCWILCKYAFIQ